MEKSMKKLFKTSPCSRVIATLNLLQGLAISFPLFLTACGDETTNVTETTGMTLVEKGAKMPDCTADNAGQMVYSTDSVAAFFCADGKWQSLKGEKGEKGDQGEQGEPGEGKQGPKGEDGTGTKGDPGAAGKSCTAQKLTSGDGYKIVCGGDSVGVVMDGSEGQSAYELSGTTLSETEWIESLKGKSCIIDNKNDEVVITCGTETSSFDKVALCGKIPYIPKKQFCDTRNDENVVYNMVSITGINYSKIWMAENLNFATSEGSSCYGDDIDNCSTYGRLYTWAAAVGKKESLCGKGHMCNLPSSDIQGICPDGWHLPTQMEWEAMFNALGFITENGVSYNDAGLKLKANSNLWENSGKGTDDYKFTALPAGSLNYYGNISGLGSSTTFWGATEKGDSQAFYMGILGISTSATLGFYEKDEKYSIRCVKDSE